MPRPGRTVAITCSASSLNAQGSLVFIPVRVGEVMSQADQQHTGVASLTPEQRFALDAWLTRYSAELRGPVNVPRPSGQPVLLGASPNTVEGVADVEGPARRELLAILDEALRNVERHADASRVRVALTGTAGSVVLDVEDDGRGLPEGRSETALHEGRYGLLGMRERAHGLGGSLSLGPAAHGRGTRVVLSAPRGSEVAA